MPAEIQPMFSVRFFCINNKKKKRKMESGSRAKFGSKIGVVLATAGSAVGLGNVWRFPYMTGENGGAAFIIVYILCVLMLGIPCMMTEFIIGRHNACNMARAYRNLSHGTPWALVGYVGVVTGFVITGYYSVVSGWCLEYIFASATGEMHGGPEYFARFFASFEKDPVKPVLWAIAIILITHFIIVRGVKEGIEKASKALMPLLFILLVLLVAAALMLPDAWKGVEFLFKPDFSKVTKDVFLGALGQAFFSMSIGMGCLCTFASYFTKDTDLTKCALQISIIDTLVAILAGLIIFPAAFSVGISPDSGPALIFITIPNVFEKAFATMPVVGYVVALCFYALLSLAALTSLISLHEVCTAFTQEEFNMSRRKGATITSAICIAVAGLCSLSLGDWSALSIGGKPLFDWFDFVSGQIMLPIGGFFTCLFAGWYIPNKLLRDEYTNMSAMRGRFFPLYVFWIRFVCPLFILMVFLNQFGII